MATRAVVTWFGDQVLALVNRRAQAGLERIAYAVRDKARQNLVDNGQIDTKFLYNSIFVATPSTTSPIHPDGEYKSLKTGQIVKRNSGEIVQVTKGAFVGAAAEYALYPELQNSYLYRALEEVAGSEAEGLMTGLLAP